jgi:hypothetical protein
MTNKQINARVMKIQNALLDLARDVENESEDCKIRARNIERNALNYGRDLLTKKEADKVSAFYDRAQALADFAETLYIDFEDNLLEEGAEKEN